MDYFTACLVLQNHIAYNAKTNLLRQLLTKNATDIIAKNV